MSLHFASIASGSNGNCYYIGSNTEAVLIDVGISCRELEKRMGALGLNMQLIKAIFISHEHSDHIRGLSRVAAKYKLPVYGSAGTLRSCGDLKSASMHIISHSDTLRVGALSISAFSKYHDAADPHSFTVGYRQYTVGIFTDIGKPCQNLAKHFAHCQAVFLEANYDEEMLEKGRYPYFLKKRIRGGMGHLSNGQALELMQKHRSSGLKYVLLSHLSKDNNCPELAKALFDKHFPDCEVIIASRYEASALYTLADEKETVQKITAHKCAEVLQLSIF